MDRGGEAEDGEEERGRGGLSVGDDELESVGPHVDGGEEAARFAGGELHGGKIEERWRRWKVSVSINQVIRFRFR